MTALLYLATTPTALASIAALCAVVVLLLTRQLRHDATEDAAAAAFVSAIRTSAYTWDHPTGWSGLSSRTDTTAFPAIVLAGTVAA